MNPNQLKQLEKLSKVFNTSNIISPDDIQEVLKGIALLLADYRKGTVELTEDVKKTFEDVISNISTEHDKVLAQVEKTSQGAVSEATDAITKALEEVKRIAKEVMEMKPKDGERGLDADEEIIVEKVLGKIVLPEYKETVLDGGEQIVDKINALDLSPENQIDASHIKNLPQPKMIGGGSTARNLYQLNDVNISSPTSNQVLKYNSTTNLWENGSGGGGGAFIDLTDVPSSYTGAGGKVVAVNIGETGLEFISASGVGTVTSVAATVPTGLTISGSPITAAGTLAIGLDTGRVIPLQSTLDAKAPLTAPTFATSITASYATLSTVPYFDASKNLVSSAVTPTELGYLSGVTSAIQTQINAKGAGTVTSVGWTGGIVSIATATTTPAFTITGTSGGIPYFSSSSTWATSATLAANALVVGGGAGVAPSTVTTGANVLTALGVAVGSAGAFVTFNGALGTPSSGTVTNLTGTASININGTVGATTPAAGTFTTATTTGNIELGHASDTTLSRVSAGVVAIEGVNIVTTSSTDTLTNKTLTAPKFADLGFIADANGNEMLIFDTVASAVNEITLANAATTGTPTISATGSDSNISIQLTPKGTGIVKGELKRFMVRLLANTTDTATGTTIGGDYRISNRAITVKAVGAYVDTAGTTNTTTIDINEAGTTILSTKITIDSTEKSSETAATAPVISDTAIAADAVVTFDIDAISTTPAKGLTVWVDYVYA